MHTATGKRKRQDSLTQSGDRCTPALSKSQLPATAATAAVAGVPNARSSKVHPKTTGKQVSTKASMQAAAVAGGSKAFMTAAKQTQGKRKTRLASSTPVGDLQSDSDLTAARSDPQVAVAHAAQDKPASVIVPDTDDEDMPDAGPSDGPAVGTAPPISGAGNGQSEGNQGQRKGGLPTAVPMLLPGASSRFSARHLKQKVEAKLPVSKATPLGLLPTPRLPPAQQ